MPCPSRDRRRRSDAWTDFWNPTGLAGTPELAHAEIATFRNRVLHVAARITRSARQVRLRIDRTWTHAEAIADAWRGIRAAFA